MDFFLVETTLPPGTGLRYEMFENDFSEQPICAGVVGPGSAIPFHVGCGADNAWQDLQGIVRLTMLGGSATMNTAGVGLQVRRFFNGQYQIWEGAAPAAIDPRLSVTKLSGEQVRLTWPTNNAAYVLEQASSLSTVAWGPVTNSVATEGDRLSVVLDIGQGQAVFRLRKP
jgi:hypothetical protein